MGRGTIFNILKILGEATEAVKSWVGSISSDLASNKDLSNLRDKIHECLNPKGGEVTARHNTVSLGKLYLNLSDVGKVKLLQLLVTEFITDKNDINHRIAEYAKNTDPDLDDQLERKLLCALESPRTRILKQFVSLPNGLKFLVNMREDVNNFKHEHKSLALLERDLRNVLSSWFDIGLLDLHQITWDSPASLLEKLILYEAVHEISSWDDLRNRLDSDRRCFAFFHNKMPDEPLIFVEVALTNNMASSIQLLLDETIPTEDPANARAAVFYSISNTQAGLSGISMGNFLIKRVVAKLSEEFQNIKIYATLSPIPNFMKWFYSGSVDQKLLDALKVTMTKDDIRSQLILLEKGECSEQLKNALMKLCAHCLLKVKHLDRAFDPVAHFHLSNGATIKRLNWLGDDSTKGFQQSAGIMVNYQYELAKIDDNHEDYIVNKKINAAKEVLQWLKK